MGEWEEFEAVESVLTLKDSGDGELTGEEGAEL